MQYQFFNNDVKADARIWLIGGAGSLPSKQLEPYWEYIRGELEEKKESFVYRYPGVDAIFLQPTEEDDAERLEQVRRIGSKAFKKLKETRSSNFSVWIEGNHLSYYTAFMEGLLLSSYAFEKYKSKKEAFLPEKVFVPYTLERDWISLWEELQIVEDAVFFARDLVNEPANVLNAITLPERIREKLQSLSTVEIRVLHKADIAQAGMGGLLGVNKGSIVEPTFTILHYDGTGGSMQPVVLIGKGITFDTGGYNLKPSEGLKTMKCDMSGAAAVAATVLAVAKNKLPVHVYGLIPATDNRINSDALVPGDVIRMYNGKTVEVNNTDAEGRLILADALAYAEQFNPALCITIATLTGAAHIAVGDHAIAGMEKRASSQFARLVNISYHVYERIVPFPMWDEFAESLKSEIADISNSGSKYGSAIIAGKFLEFFTNRPFIHLDIAGPAFLDKTYHYQPAGGTGVGVRLFYQFLRNYSENA